MQGLVLGTVGQKFSFADERHQAEKDRHRADERDGGCCPPSSLLQLWLGGDLRGHGVLLRVCTPISSRLIPRAVGQSRDWPGIDRRRRRCRMLRTHGDGRHASGNIAWIGQEEQTVMHVLVHRFSGSVAVLALVAQGLADHCPDPLREFRRGCVDQRLRGVDRDVQFASHQPRKMRSPVVLSVGVTGLEGEVTRQHLSENGAKRERVRRFVNVVTPRLFRGHVERRTPCGLACSREAFIQDLGDAEIENVDLVAWRDLNILRLEVTMDDSVGMNLCDDADRLFENRQGSTWNERHAEAVRGVEHVEEGLPLDELAHHVVERHLRLCRRLFGCIRHDRDHG